MELFTGFLTIVLFGYFAWFAAITAVLLLVFFLSDAGENGFWATGALVIYIAIFWFWGSFGESQVPNLFTLSNIGIYLGIGFVYSLLKSILIGSRKDREIKENYLGDDPPSRFVRANRENKMSILKEARTVAFKDVVNNLAGDVFRWWLMWPVNLLSTIGVWAKDLFLIFWRNIDFIFIAMVKLGFGKDPILPPDPPVFETDIETEAKNR